MLCMESWFPFLKKNYVIFLNYFAKNPCNLKIICYNSNKLQVGYIS